MKSNKVQIILIVIILVLLAFSVYLYWELIQIKETLRLQEFFIRELYKDFK